MSTNQRKGNVMTKLGRVSGCAVCAVVVATLTAGCDPVDRDALVIRLDAGTGCVALWGDAAHEPNLPAGYAFGSEGDYGVWTDATGAVVGYGADEDAAVYASPTDAMECEPYPYAVGDGGQGTPDAHDVAACPGEVVYSPADDAWLCEAQP